MQQRSKKEQDGKTVKSEDTTRPRRVHCNGGAQGSGHPVVYLSLNEEGFVVCPYCSRRFGNKP